MTRRIGLLFFALSALIFLTITTRLFGVSFLPLLRKALYVAASMGLILFSIHYLTQKPKDRYKTPLYVRLIHFFSLAAIAVGLMFKIMHWPYATALLILGFIGAGISFILEKNEIVDEDSDLIDS
jgi:hypothetical protein